jgi:hypothetical protein
MSERNSDKKKPLNEKQLAINLVKSLINHEQDNRQPRVKKKAPVADPPQNLPAQLKPVKKPRKGKAAPAPEKNKIKLQKVAKKTLEIAIYTDRNPWDYHPWETMASFAGFQIYLRMAPHLRSISRVKFELFKLTYPENEQVQSLKYEDWVKSDLNSPSMGVTTSISAWCSKYHWAERAQAWDNYLAKIEQQALMEKRRRHAQKCIDIGEELSDTGIAAVKKLKDIKKIPSYETSIKLIEAGIKLERTGLGLDEVIAPQVNMVQNVKISVDKLEDNELNQLVKIQTKNAANNPEKGQPVIFNLENVIDHEDIF